MCVCVHMFAQTEVLKYELLALITENRLNNVLSKHGRISRNDKEGSHCYCMYLCVCVCMCMGAEQSQLLAVATVVAVTDCSRPVAVAVPSYDCYCSAFTMCILFCFYDVHVTMCTFFILCMHMYFLCFCSRACFYIVHAYVCCTLLLIIWCKEKKNILFTFSLNSPAHIPRETQLCTRFDLSCPFLLLLLFSSSLPPPAPPAPAPLPPSGSSRMQTSAT